MRCFSGVSLALGVSGVSTRTHLNENFHGTRGRPPATRVEAWAGPGHLVRSADPNSRLKWLRGTAALACSLLLCTQPQGS